MTAQDLKIGEKYIDKEKRLITFNAIYGITKPNVYRFTTDIGNLQYYYEYDIPTCVFSINEPIPLESTPCTHSFKLYVGLTDLFRYCTICNKKE